MPIQRWSDDIWVVQLADEPLLSEDLTAVLEDFSAGDTAGKSGKVMPSPDLVLDLTAVTYLNSSNLSQLLRLRQAGVRRHSRLCLAGVSGEIWNLFLVTGLDKIFAFAENVPTALAGLQVNKDKKRPG